MLTHSKFEHHLVFTNIGFGIICFPGEHTGFEFTNFSIINQVQFLNILVAGVLEFTQAMTLSHLKWIEC